MSKLIDEVYKFKSNIYLSFKDISIGIMIYSNREPIYGTAGRITGIEINIVFIHIKFGMIRHGFRR